jgi:hypothetical protein
MERDTRGLHKEIDERRQEVAPKGEPWSRVNTYRDYVRGRNKTVMGADQLKTLRHLLKNPFSDNILKKIVSEHANRLRISRFDVEDERVGEYLFNSLWVKNRLPQLFSEVIFATLRDGNHAVTLNWLPDETDPTWGGRVSLSRERWWNGTDGVFVFYDDRGIPEYAVKEWPVKGGIRRTVYFDAAIFRFIKRGSGWEPYVLPGDELYVSPDGVAMPGFIPWVKRDGLTGIGIPVVHFANGSDDDTFYGRSLLAGGALAFQDQINAIQHDILAASAMNGSPQTYSTGFQLPADPSDVTGKTRVAVPTGPGVHHHSDNPDAKFGTIPPGDLSQLSDAYRLKRASLCTNTNTPLHTITGEWPSGEAIFRAEMPLVQDTRTLAEGVGPSASTIAHRATEIANAFGIGETLDEDSPITTVFEPPEQRDPTAVWATAKLAEAHVSKREVLRIAGYPPDRIEAILEEMQEEAEESARTMQMTFNRGPNLIGLGDERDTDDQASDSEE